MRFRLAQLVTIIAFAAGVQAAQLAVLQNGSTLRHEHRAVIGCVTRLYTGSGNDEYVDIPTAEIDHFEADSTQAEAPSVARISNIDSAVSHASEETQLDPDLIASVIHAESGFNPNAVSSKGAQGLMQLMPRTASNLGVANAFDPMANVEGGSRYLRELLDRYNSNLIKALAAYNAGPQRVQEYNGVPPYRETQAYVARIVRDFNRKKLAEQKAAKVALRKSVKPADRKSPSLSSSPQIAVASTAITRTPHP